MNKRLEILSMVLVLSMLGLTSCSGTLALPAQLGNQVPAEAIQALPTEMPSAQVNPSMDVDLAALEVSLESIYEEVNPSVVNIRVLQQVMPQDFSQIPGFPFFGQPSPQEPQTPQGGFNQVLGSGFVWDKQGYIVTNNHVIEGADKIEITFYDGSVRPGELVGADKDSDLAVLKVNMPADELHPVQLADSTEVKVGQLAIAIGNPFGLQGTMTMGVVSAVGRSLPVESSQSAGPSYTIPDVIQTDAPINPGNSGGVLLDDAARVIGVTSAIISPVQANAGIGFAIPSAIVQRVVPSLIEQGSYQHPWLGLSGTSLTPGIAEAMGLDPDQRGVLVVEVISGSPTDKAGLQGSDRTVTIDGQDVPVGGDVIIAIDGQPVKAFDDLVTYLARSTEVGQKVSLTVLRSGIEKTFELTLAVRPSSQPSTEAAQSGKTGAWLGIMATTLTPQIAQAMNLEGDQQGVLIAQVEAGSPADDAGLRGSHTPATIDGQQVMVGGDVITAFDGQPITGMQELQALLQQANPGQEVALTILREGERLQVSVILGERPSS
jgi:serine protease Do